MNKLKMRKRSETKKDNLCSYFLSPARFSSVSQPLGPWAKRLLPNIRQFKSFHCLKSEIINPVFITWDVGHFYSRAKEKAGCPPTSENSLVCPVCARRGRRWSCGDPQPALCKAGQQGWVSVPGEVPVPSDRHCGDCLRQTQAGSARQGHFVKFLVGLDI